MEGPFRVSLVCVADLMQLAYDQGMKDSKGWGPKPQFSSGFLRPPANLLP